MELIKINDGKITARELFEFLEMNPANYVRWCKVNILDNEFYEENKDWTTHLNDENSGKILSNYKLTIDFAKHLCMLSRSERGKQARAYFVECEKQALNKNTSIQELSPQLQFMINLELKQKEQEKSIAVHNERLEKLEFIQSKKAEIVQELPPVNPMTQRAQLNQIIRGYSERNDKEYSNVWNKLYEQFLSRYSINLKTRAKNRKQSVLDYSQHNGCLADLLSLSIELFC